MRTKTRFSAIATLLLLAGMVSLPPAPARATSAVLYVDGKTGADSNSGADLGHAFRTIAAAASALPAKNAASGWTIRVVGYTDFVYRERPIPPGWDRSGTTGAPVTFEAVGYNGTSSGYTMPIVSGADPAPAAGKSWSVVSSGVWKTPWSTAPFDFGQLGGSLKTALFQDVTGWLWEQTSLTALQSAASSGSGGYWWSSGWLYVAPSAHASPSGHAFDVVTRNSFFFYGLNGVGYVTVRGFEVRHSANGIAFVKGVDGGTAMDDRLIGNLLMGVAVSGRMNGSTADPARDAVIERVVGAYNTLQAVKLDEGAVDATVCDNTFHDNGLQGIKVQGPPGGTGYTGTTTGNLVCRNDLHDQDFNPTGTQYNNASGLTIANGARSTTVSDNRIWGNDVGIHITQESAGMPAMTGTVLDHNRVWSNRRFGLNLFDGYNGSGSGSLTSSYDLYWSNGIGVMADRGTSNKTLDHVTVWHSATEGIKVAGSTSNPASLSVADSLVTGNGDWGIWVVTGNTATLSHVGLNSNATGNIKGSPSQTAVNTKSPGYLTTDAARAGFLTITPGSFQFTAGPSSSPIGALWWVSGFIDIVGMDYEADVNWLAAQGITKGCSTYYFCPEDPMTRGQMAAFFNRALNLPATTTDYFTDDDGTTFEGDINRLAESGITKGCSLTTYCPLNLVTRGQLAAFVVRALGLPATSTDYFSDDDGTTFEGDINALAEAGIATGCTATTFCPNADATRATMAVFLHRALG